MSNKIESFHVDLSVSNAKDISNALLLLHSEQYITEATYNYLNDKIVQILQNIVFPLDEHFKISTQEELLLKEKKDTKWA